MKSQYTLASIDEMNPDTIADLSPADLESLNLQIVEAAALLQVRADKLAAGLDARYGGVLQVERDKKAKEFGKISAFDGDYQIDHTLKKKVEWDREGLKQLRETIRAHGDDPDVYIKVETKTEYKVSETAYEGWPADIRAAFSPYRTVKISGSPSWHIAERKQT